MKWYHNVYSEEAMTEMQSEAEHRVRETQERQRLIASGEYARPDEPRRTPPPPADQAFPQSPARHAGHDVPGLRPLAEMLQHGGDEPVVLALLWILWNENADRKLLLALLYLLL